MAPDALRLFSLQTATPRTALKPFQRWPPTGSAACGRLTIHLDIPCHAGLAVTCLNLLDQDVESCFRGVGRQRQAQLSEEIRGERR
jgi:hypothetical protein